MDIGRGAAVQNAFNHGCLDGINSFKMGLCGIVLTLLAMDIRISHIPCQVKNQIETIPGIVFIQEIAPGWIAVEGLHVRGHCDSKRLYSLVS